MSSTEKVPARLFQSFQAVLPPDATQLRFTQVRTDPFSTIGAIVNAAPPGATSATLLNVWPPPPQNDNNWNRHYGNNGRYDATTGHGNNPDGGSQQLAETNPLANFSNLQESPPTGGTDAHELPAEPLRRPQDQHKNQARPAEKI